MNQILAGERHVPLAGKPISHLQELLSFPLFLLLFASKANGKNNHFNCITATALFELLHFSESPPLQKLSWKKRLSWNTIEPVHSSNNTATVELSLDQLNGQSNHFKGVYTSLYLSIPLRRTNERRYNGTIAETILIHGFFVGRESSKRIALQIPNRPFVVLLPQTFALKSPFPSPKHTPPLSLSLSLSTHNRKRPFQLQNNNGSPDHLFGDPFPPSNKQKELSLPLLFRRSGFRPFGSIVSLPPVRKVARKWRPLPAIGATSTTEPTDIYHLTRWTHSIVSVGWLVWPTSVVITIVVVVVG